MDVEQNRTIHRVSNTFIYSYLSYSNLPKKYKTVDFSSFFLLIAAKQLSKYKGGFFTILELLAVSGLGRAFVVSWCSRLCSAGFIERFDTSTYEFTHFGRLSLKQFNRNLYRYIKTPLLPIYEDYKYNPFDSLVAASGASGVGGV